MVGCANEMLLTDAANLVPLGPWQPWVWSHGLVPRPTVKKKCSSIFWGTLAGYCRLAKLRNLFEKLAAKAVSFRAGKVGLKSGSFLTETVVLESGDGHCSYSRIPATVELSKVPAPVKYGVASMRKVAAGNWGLVLRRTLVVCPGAIRIVSVSKGLT